MGPRGARARVERRGGVPLVGVGTSSGVGRRGGVVIGGAVLSAVAPVFFDFGTFSEIGVIGVLARVWRWWFSGVFHILDGLVGLLDSVVVSGVLTLGGGT